MDRIVETNKTKKTNKRRKKKMTKRKAVVILVLILICISILTGIFFLINRLIPVKDVTSDNIKINLSTKKPTGSSITATVSTKTKYDIYYFIDYTVAEEEYYGSENASEEATTKPKIEIKDINNKEYKKVNNSTFQIENNGVVYLKYGRFGKLNKKPYVFEISNIDKNGPEIGEIQTSSTYSSITVTVSAFDENSTELEYGFRLADSNQFISTNSKNTYTFTGLTADESYTIFVRVKDKFGNESEAVTEAVASVEQNEVVEKKVYHFKVNVAANTVTVYDLGDDGKYSNPIKAFICSTGKSTPKSGTYKISDRYRWRSLFGGVYGQYAVRICGNILFHSVPYKQMYANTLKYEEYDKLGTSASMGCVRLCVRDAKWIYDNAKTGSTVEFYSDESNPGPLGKPKAQKISDDKEKRNWDPTDPDKHNPWLGGNGEVTKVTIIEEGNYSNTKNTTNTTNTSATNQNVINVTNDAITSNIVSNTVANTTNTVTDNTTSPITNTTTPPEPETNTPDTPGDGGGSGTDTGDNSDSSGNGENTNPGTEGGSDPTVDPGENTGNGNENPPPSDNNEGTGDSSQP